MTSSLVAIGYKQSWIKSMMEQYQTRNLQHLDTFMREHKEELLKKEQENQRTSILDNLSKLGQSIDKEKLDVLITNKDPVVIGELILNCWQELQKTTSDSTETENDGSKEGLTWFYETVNQLGIKGSVNSWLQDKSRTRNDSNSVYQLFDLTESKEERQLPKKSLQYSHQTFTQEQYLSSRLACEYGLVES